MRAIPAPNSQRLADQQAAQRRRAGSRRASGPRLR